MAPKCVLGIDPPNAWGVVVGDRYVDSGSWSKKLTANKLAMQIVQAVEIATSLGATHCVIEDQWVEWRDQFSSTERAGRARSALITAKRAGMWAQEWQRHMPRNVLYAPPQVWRKAVIGSMKGMRAKQMKEACIDMVQAIYQKLKGEDESEALGIARYGSFLEWRKP